MQRWCKRCSRRLSDRQSGSMGGCGLLGACDWRRPRMRRISSPRCSAVSGAPAPSAATSRCPSPTKARFIAALRGAASRVGAIGGARPFACAPATGVISRPRIRRRRAGRPILQQLLPGERDQGGLWQQYRQRPTDERQVLFGTAERVPLPQRDWLRAAPATARTRSGWRRSRSRTTRRCARATSSPAPTA